MRLFLSFVDLVPRSSLTPLKHTGLAFVLSEKIKEANQHRPAPLPNPSGFSTEWTFAVSATGNMRTKFLRTPP